MMANVLLGLYAGGNIGIPGGPMYTIAKHGLMGYWRSMCIKLKGMKEDEVPFS